MRSARGERRRLRGRDGRIENPVDTGVSRCLPLEVALEFLEQLHGQGLPVQPSLQGTEQGSGRASLIAGLCSETKRRPISAVPEPFVDGSAVGELVGEQAQVAGRGSAFVRLPIGERGLPDVELPCECSLTPSGCLAGFSDALAE